MWGVSVFEMWNPYNISQNFKFQDSFFGIKNPRLFVFDETENEKYKTMI